MADRLLSRSDLQQLAEQRIKEAKALLDAPAGDCWPGAYYLAGYAAECALKACIAKRTKAEEFPPRETKDFYTHKLATLVKTADLEGEHAAEVGAKRQFTSYWILVLKWNESSRYDCSKTEADARALYRAMTDPTDGVLQWVRRHW